MEQIVHREIENIRSWRNETMVIKDDVQGQEKFKRDFVQSLEGMAAIKDLINLLAREYGQGRFPELMANLKALLMDEGIDVFREDYREAINKGDLLDMDPRILSSILMSSLVGYHLASMYFGSEPGGVNRQEFTDGLVDLIRNRNSK